MIRIDLIAQKIKELGFTAYEAKAYVSLLQQNPVTRYELSKNSGVPRSAIYNVIHKLERIGAVNAQSSEPEKYVPLPPEQLFELLQRQFRSKLDNARKSLKDFESELVSDHLWNIVGYENMLLKVKEMIQKAQKTIYLSVWQRELALIRKDLHDAEARGVDILLFSFTELNFDSQKVFSYRLNESDLEKFWAHKIILITDKNELLMGEADHLQQKKIAWTSNRALIDIATNHIILDITIYGIRLKKDINAYVSGMQNGETTSLGDLLQKKYPGIPF